MSRQLMPVVVLALAPLLALSCGTVGNDAAANGTETAQACTPPRASWISPGPLGGGGLPINRISVNHQGEIYWNGQRTDLAHITHYLSITATMNPEPAAFLQTEMGVSCALVERIRDEMEHRLHCSQHGPCGEGIWTIWEVTPAPPGTPPS
jgi:hypothetical protein